MNLIEQIKAKRIGPDLIATHWLLHFNFGRKLLSKKLSKCGKNVCLRPGCTLVGMDLIEIGDNVVVRPGVQIHASYVGRVKVIIENNVLLAPNVLITAENHNYKDPNIPIMLQGSSSAPIIIREGAWLGANAVILMGVTVGKNSVVAAGAVVTKNVPDFCVVGGVPAKVISEIKG